MYVKKLKSGELMSSDTRKAHNKISATKFQINVTSINYKTMYLNCECNVKTRPNMDDKLYIILALKIRWNTSTVCY
jgi:hypothetical protein